ncbi:MAG: SPOR domain-containing protein [Acidobacteria bacterium]|nr:SPOR domain-containing protein [Acidobacteriota bacterium]
MCLLTALSAQGQVFRLGAGSSSLFQAQGGSLEVRGRNYEGWVGVGETNGRLRVGMFSRFKYHDLTFTVGDDNLKFEMPTDIFGSSHYFPVRGVGVARSFGDTKITAFAGTTSTTFGSPFFRAADTDQPVGLVFVDSKLTDNLKLFSRNLVAQRNTSIHGLEWKTNAWLTTSVAAGLGSGERYFAASFDAERGWISMKGSYIEAGGRFRRIIVDTPVSTEVDGANLVVTVRPRADLTITAGHQNFLEPNLALNQNAARATVNNLQASGVLKGFRVGGGLYQSAVRGQGNLGTFLWAGRRVTDHVDLNVNYFRSRPELGSGTSTLSVVVRETLTPRIELLQLVNRSSGQTTMSFGGQFLSNRFTIGVDYQTLYIPFSPTPFTQALALKIRFRPFGSVDLNAQTYLTPEGKLRYTAFGNTALYRYSGLRVGESGQNFTLARNIVRGRVVDEKNEPLNGAALRIGKELAFTDGDGRFFLRVKKARVYAVTVALDEFILPGYFEVVKAPAEVQAVGEDSADEIMIVVRRVSPPKRPTHTAEGPSPVAPAPAAGYPAPTTPQPMPGQPHDTARQNAPVYVVQVGAFSSLDKARAMVETLRRQGFPAFFTADPGRDPLIRVLIGPVHSAADAEVFRKRLLAGGYPALVKRQSLREVARSWEETEPAAGVAGAPAAEAGQAEPGAIR